jgi:hypothetical protein
LLSFSQRRVLGKSSIWPHLYKPVSSGKESSFMQLLSKPEFAQQVSKNYILLQQTSISQEREKQDGYPSLLVIDLVFIHDRKAEIMLIRISKIQYQAARSLRDQNRLEKPLIDCRLSFGKTEIRGRWAAEFNISPLRGLPWRPAAGLPK